MFQVGYFWRGHPNEKVKVPIFLQPDTYFETEKDAEKSLAVLSAKYPFLADVLQVIQVTR